MDDEATQRSAKSTENVHRETTTQTQKSCTKRSSK